MSKVIWPMKCKAIKSQSELERILATGDYVVEEKIKGVRGVIQINDGRLQVFSRGSSKFEPDKPIELTHRLPHFEMSSLMLNKLEGCIFDCELFNPELDDSEIAGKLNARSELPTDERISAYIFDLIAAGGVEELGFAKKAYAQRLNILDKKFELLSELPWVQRPRQSRDSDAYFIEEILDNGGEGVVLKNIHSQYVYTEKNFKRVGFWYKYKRKDTIDAVITGCKPPEKWYRHRETREFDHERLTKFYQNGWIGSVEFEYTLDAPDAPGFVSVHRGFCSGMTDELRAQLSDPKHPHNINPEYIGALIEVEYFEINQYGNLEHPRLKRVRLDLEK